MNTKKKCLYCDYSSTKPTATNTHMYKYHKSQLQEALKNKYKDFKMPSPPFTMENVSTEKSMILCLCCNGIWTSEQCYQKHVIASNGKCSPANQVMALSEYIGIKFHDKAYEQSNNSNANNSLRILIDKLISKQSKLEETIIAQASHIKNLQNQVFVIKPWLNNTKDSPLTLSQPIDTPIIPTPAISKPPVTNTIVSSDEEDDSSDYEDDSSNDEYKKPITIEKCNTSEWCWNRDMCGYQGSIWEGSNWTDKCLICKRWTCKDCIRKTGSDQRKPVCTRECFMKLKTKNTQN